MCFARPGNKEESNQEQPDLHLQGKGDQPEVHKHAKINREPFKADICKRTLETAGAWQKRLNTKRKFSILYSLNLKDP